MSRFRLCFASLAAGLLSVWVVSVSTTAVQAHELWIDMEPVATAGQEHVAHVCWGHAGQREAGPRLAGQQGKLTATVVRPDGSADVPLATGEDSFIATIVPGVSGSYVVGAVLQVGIIDQEMHGIPAHTRMVMYGKAEARVGKEPTPAAAPLGDELELVCLTPAAECKSGGLISLRVLQRGKPIGGRHVLVTASTTGPRSATDDPRVQTPVWSNQAMADPKTGEVTFPLIAGGQHIFLVKYLDETPGTYDGDRNDSSSFSHLRKGDTFERTMNIATFTLLVSPE